jgi:hypothetical protein
MDRTKLIEYELPSITEKVSIGWLQNVIAKYTARRVNRKIKRYNLRQERKEFVNKLRGL